MFKVQMTEEDLVKLMKNNEICNIHLIRIDDFWLNDINDWCKEGGYREGDLVWVAGYHGYEGVLNDGGILLHDYTLEGLLNKIADYVIQETPEPSPATCISVSSCDVMLGRDVVETLTEGFNSSERAILEVLDVTET